MAIGLKSLVDYFDEADYCGKPNPLIGNDTAKLTFPIQFFISHQDCLIHGPAGGGKTTLLDGTLALYAGEEAFSDNVRGLIVASAGSGKSMVTRTMESRLKYSPFFVMRELQTFLEDNTNKEIFKTWMEGKPFIYHRNDAGNDDTKSYILDPPCIATTIADENEKALKLGEEVDRRFFRIAIESTEELNRRVHRAKADIDALTPEKRFRLSSQDVEALRDHLVTASNKCYGMKRKDAKLLGGWRPDHKIRHMVNPSSPSLQTKVPSRATRSNSVINYLFKAQRGVATFNWEKTEGHFGDIMMVLPVDNYHAWEMCGSSVVYSSMGINGTLGADILELIYERSIYDDPEELIPSRDNATHIDDIVNAMRAKADITRQTILRNIASLQMNGFVFADEPRNKYLWKHSSQRYDIGATWPEVMEETRAFVKENYPDQFDEYRRYLDDPIGEFYSKTNGDIVWGKVHILDIEDRMARKDEEVQAKNKKVADVMSGLDSYFDKG